MQLDAAVLEECAGMDSHWNVSSGYLCLNKGLASPSWRPSFSRCSSTVDTPSAVPQSFS